jgi:hypothetical protein
MAKVYQIYPLAAHEKKNNLNGSFVLDSDTSPHICLWRAVLIQAVRDCFVKDALMRDRARAYIEINNEDFLDVCDLAEVTPVEVRVHLKSLDKEVASGNKLALSYIRQA